MTTLTIPHRFGAEPITVEIDCPEYASLAVKVSAAVRLGADLSNANLSRADLSNANLSRANLFEVDLSRADLSNANLSRADLSRADLSRANLSNADLSGANLSNADLYGANLYEADLSRANLFEVDFFGATIRGEVVKALIASVNRLIDPYAFLAFRLENGEVKVLAGCRWLSVPEFRAHVSASYPDTPKATETIRILDYIDACAGDNQ